MNRSLQIGFQHIWEQHKAAIARVAASYELNLHKREELIQEIALACWKSLENCKDPSAIKSFLLRIAHNKSVDHVSKQVKEPKGTEDISLLPEDKLVSIETAKFTQQQQQLLQTMHKLPLEQKQVVALLLEGMSYQQIAEITGLSSSNVGVIINRGKKRLQELLHAA